MSEKPVTINDVAKAAGVSIATVSRVINHYEHVRSELRDQVRAAMIELNYVPNRQARRLVGGKSAVVGLMMASLGGEYNAEILRGIEEALDIVEYDLLLYTTYRRKAKEDYYARMIAKGLADGLIVLVPMVGESYLGVLQEMAYPHVIVDVDYTDGKSWSVGCTNWQGGYDATNYLLQLNHRRIAIVTDLLELSTSSSRLEGYKAALQEYGVAYDPDLVKVIDYVELTTPKPIRKPIDELINMADPPTAIFTTGDWTAFNIMEYLRLHNLLVPQDISLIGFDDVPRASSIYPGLTTIHHPLYEIGKTAVRLLLDQIDQSDLPPQHIQLETRLVRRESCLALPTIS